MLLTDQYKPYLKTNLKGTKWYNKAHNSQYGIKHLELIIAVICGVDAHLQGV